MPPATVESIDTLRSVARRCRERGPRALVRHAPAGYHAGRRNARRSDGLGSDHDRPAVYFLLHVPKTAGQTIQQHLAAHCPPGVFWQSHRRLRPGRRVGPADLPDPARARVVAGHHLGRSLEALFPGREIRRIVLLRDPESLLVSFYNWQMVDHLSKGLGTYGFELHRQALPRDFIAHFLLSRWLETPWPALLAMADAEKYRRLNRALAGFWFVGAHRDCDRLIAALAADLGIPATAPRRNASERLEQEVGWRRLAVGSLPAATRERIRAGNPIDRALWQSWRGAGFEAGSVRPRPLEPDCASGFFGHELVRPWFTARRAFHRVWVPRLRLDGGAGAHLACANRARDAGDWGRAARHYRKAVAGMPEAAAIWVQYGHALKESGDVAAAEGAYRRSLRLSPDVADTHLQLGHALKLQGRAEEAVAAYLRAAALDPLLSHPRDELIRLGWTAGQIDRAVSGVGLEPVSESPGWR